MNYSDYRITLDIHKTVSQASLPVKLGDTAYRLCITLTEDGKPYIISEGSYALFTARKPDGNFICNGCTIENNTIYYELTPQTTAAVGNVACEILLYKIVLQKNGEVLPVQITSPRFNIFVNKTIYDNDEVVEGSEKEVTVLTNLIAEADETIRKAETAAETAEEAATAANEAVDNVNSKIPEIDSAVSGANAATSKANEATSKANTATSNANTAAQRAETAAGNANSAAEEATEATELANNAASAAHAAVDEMSILFANAIKGKVSGKSISIGDVSPVEHELDVAVVSKNHCPESGFDTMSSNGSANTYDASTHTITMTEDAFTGSGRYGKPCNNLVIGEIYTVSFDIKGTVGKNVHCGWDNNRIGITLTNNFIRYSVAYQVRVSNPALVFYSLATSDGGLAAGEYMQFANVQIEKGDTASEYTPFVNPASVTVTANGKTYTPDANGKVSGVTSEYPAMTFSTDSTGAVLDVTYNRDLDAYLKTLSPAAASLTIYANKWEQVDIGNGVYQWQQVVNVNNAAITPNSKVDLKLSAEQVSIFYNKSLAFVTENEDGVVTVCCIGVKPTNDYTIQVNVTEVVVNG